VTQGRIRGLERLRLEFGACASRLASLDAVVAEAGLKLGHGFVCLRSHAASELLVRRACERFTPDVVDERAAQPDQRVRRFRPGPSRSKPGSARAPGGPHAGDFADASRSLAPLVSGREREPLVTFEPPSPATAVPPRADHQARRSASPWCRCRRCAGTVAVAAAIAGVVTSEGAGTIAGFAVRLAVVSLAGFAVRSCAPAVEAWADRSPRAVWASSAPC
jgi:hypothetical protein